MKAVLHISGDALRVVDETNKVTKESIDLRLVSDD